MTINFQSPPYSPQGLAVIREAPVYLTTVGLQREMVKDVDFRTKIAYIVETDGLLKDDIESFVIKKIKADMDDDCRFKNIKPHHIHAALILKFMSWKAVF